MVEGIGRVRVKRPCWRDWRVRVRVVRGGEEAKARVWGLIRGSSGSGERRRLGGVVDRETRRSGSSGISVKVVSWLSEDPTLASCFERSTVISSFEYNFRGQVFMFLGFGSKVRLSER